MAIVPRQPEADDEVIAFWKEKKQFSADEIASLAAGVNPFAWEKYQSLMPFDEDEREALLKQVSSEKWQAIKDILVVLGHRTDPLLGMCDLFEWRMIFQECKLPFPEQLNPPVSENIKKKLQEMRSPDFEKELAQQLEEIEKQKGKPIILAKWFLHDTWSADEAMLLLIGLDPDGTVLGHYEAVSGETVKCIEMAFTLDGFESFPYSFMEKNSEKSYVDPVQLSSVWRYLVSLWESGNHSERNPPMYYIEWSKSKKYEIPWLGWALDNGMIGSQKLTDDKPITTTERNTLLTVIAALCDYSDIKHQERGAATQIANMTEEIGAPVTDDTIRKILSKIPDALEARKK